MARRTGNRGIAIIFLGLSLVAAVFATAVLFLLFRNLNAEIEEAQRGQETVAVVVAARELPQGRTLTEEDVRLQEVPPEYLPETIYHEVDEVLGRVPRERILPGESVRQERLAKPEAGVGLNAIIPAGQRALSLNITDASGVSGFLNPGNYVDVLVTIEDTKGKNRTITLLQAVQVLAVDNRLSTADGGEISSEDAKAKPSVTLAVTPEQAQKVIHSNVEGEVVLTLRNDIDVTHQETHGAATDKMIGKKGKRIVPTRKASGKPKPPDTSIMIIQGGNITTEKIGASDGN